MQHNELSYAVRLGVGLKYLGHLCVVAAVLTSVPLIASVIWSDYVISIRYGIVAVLLGGFGAWSARFPRPRRVQHNEVLVIARRVCSILTWTRHLGFATVPFWKRSFRQR